MRDYQKVGFTEKKPAVEAENGTSGANEDQDPKGDAADDVQDMVDSIPS